MNSEHIDSIPFILYLCVFVFQERLKALTDIVWPEIALLVKKRIEQAKEQGEAFITFFSCSCRDELL